MVRVMRKKGAFEAGDQNIYMTKQGQHCGRFLFGVSASVELPCSGSLDRLDHFLERSLCQALEIPQTVSA